MLPAHLYFFLFFETLPIGSVLGILSRNVSQSKVESQFEFFLETLRPHRENVLESRFTGTPQHVYVCFFASKSFWQANTGDLAALFDITPKCIASLSHSPLAIFNEFKNSASPRQALPTASGGRER